MMSETVMYPACGWWLYGYPSCVQPRRAMTFSSYTCGDCLRLPRLSVAQHPKEPESSKRSDHLAQWWTFRKGGGNSFHRSQAVSMRVGGIEWKQSINFCSMHFVEMWFTHHNYKGGGPMCRRKCLKPLQCPAWGRGPMAIQAACSRAGP